MSDAPESMIEQDEPKSWTRFIKWAVLGVVVLVALVYGAIFIYANVINDSPDELDTDDLSAAIDATTPSTAPAATSAAPTTAASEAPAETTAPAATTATTAAPTPDTTASSGELNYDGEWTPTQESEFGYRVDEVLAGVNVTAVGRSNEIDGAMTISGTQVTDLAVEVEVASITSDDSRRDGQFAGRIMETDQFPTATFVLTAPIELGTVPAVGEQITTTATGDLTLHGVTRTVTFDVTAEGNGERIGVLGNIPILFSDYDIDDPSFGVVSTEDNGLLEFVLVFERA
ncbi:MAG: YceI family protein [Actinomycetota bacterium]